MPKYSDKSIKHLATCDPRLQNIFNVVIKRYDNSILCGYRDQHDQTLCYKSGASKLKFPKSKHNKKHSKDDDYDVENEAIFKFIGDIEKKQKVTFYALHDALFDYFNTPRRPGSIVNALTTTGDWSGEREERSFAF